MFASVERRLLAPAGCARDGEREVAAEQPVRLDEAGEVLPRLERRDGERVGAAEVEPVPVRREPGVDARVGDMDALGRDAERLGDVVGGEAAS